MVVVVEVGGGRMVVVEASGVVEVGGGRMVAVVVVVAVEASGGRVAAVEAGGGNMVAVVAVEATCPLYNVLLEVVCCCFPRNKLFTYF